MILINGAQGMATIDGVRYWTMVPYYAEYSADEGFRMTTKDDRADLRVARSPAEAVEFGWLRPVDVIDVEGRIVPKALP